MGRQAGMLTQHAVQPIMPALLEEPLDVRPRKPAQGVEAERGVLCHDGPAHLLGRQAALLLRDVLGPALPHKRGAQ